MIVGITAGAMDLLHCGHLLMLKECKQHCDRLIVALQTDPSLDRPQKHSPIETLEERTERLLGCKYVDHIIVYNTEADLLDLLTAVHYDIRFVGEDYIGKEFTGKHLEKQIYYNSRKHNYSTTNLRQRIFDAEKEKDK